MDTFKFSFFDEDATDEKPTETDESSMLSPETSTTETSESETSESGADSTSSSTSKPRPAPMPVLGFADDEDEEGNLLAPAIGNGTTPGTPLAPTSTSPEPPTLDLRRPRDNFEFSLDIPDVSSSAPTLPSTPKMASTPSNNTAATSSTDPFDFPLDVPEPELEITAPSAEAAGSDSASDPLSTDPFNFGFEVAEELEEHDAPATSEAPSAEADPLEADPLEVDSLEIDPLEADPFDFALDTPETGEPVPDPLDFSLEGTGQTSEDDFSLDAPALAEPVSLDEAEGTEIDPLALDDFPTLEESETITDPFAIDFAALAPPGETDPLPETTPVSAPDETANLDDIANIEGSALETPVAIDEALPLETPFVAALGHHTDEETPVQTAEPVLAEPAIEPVAPVATEPAQGTLFAVPQENPVEESEGEQARTPLRPALRVAVLGASGVGRHHARWLDRHGCNVVSFLGSSNTSIVATEESLRESIGFAGQGYDSLDKLLAESAPEAVVIASPPQFHFAQAQQCLESGVHVLCEKPLVYAPTRNIRENVSGAKELVKTATKKKLVFGTQLQYAGAAPILCKLAGTSLYDVGDFAMEMETSNPKSPRDPRELWIDLAPHPISVVQKLAGNNAKLVEESIQIMPQVTESHTAVSVRFGIQCEDGRLLIVRTIVRAFDGNIENRAPHRRFAFNGRVVQYNRDPRTNRAQFTAPDGYDNIYDDPIDYLIGNFVRVCQGEGELLVSGALGLQNLEWLLKIADKLG